MLGYQQGIGQALRESEHGFGFSEQAVLARVQGGFSRLRQGTPSGRDKILAKLGKALAGDR
jgi:hypothetical protein